MTQKMKDQRSILQMGHCVKVSNPSSPAQGQAFLHRHYLLHQPALCDSQNQGYVTWHVT